MRTGGKVLIDALVQHGVDTVFCVPGESYIGALEALTGVRDRIRVITCRHESGATYMAEAYGKLTGRVGVAFVTRGPGACNGAIGVHTALQDSSPMVLFIGQIPREFRGREAFQEVDYEAMYAPLAKWAVEVDDPARLPEIASRAFATARGGRPGPVVVSLPEDVLVEEVDVADVPPAPQPRPEPSDGELARMRELLSKAERPLVIVGGGGWDSGTCADLVAFAEANGLPVVASFRSQDLFDNDHANFVGELGYNTNPKLAQRVREADLIMALGARLGETATQAYTLIRAPKPDQTLIHVYPDHSELNRVFRADLGIASHLGAFLAKARREVQVDPAPWAAWLKSGRDDYEVWTVPGEVPGELQMGALWTALRDILPDEAIVTTDAGNFAGWTSRFFRFRKYRTLLGPTNGSMGYGVPAAIAAKAAKPDVPVIAYCGDGGILMTGNELATAVQHDLPIVLIIANNSMYGTIRMHEEREFPGREIATELRNPDFVAWAKAFGAEGAKVTRTDEFAPAVEAALARGGCTVIELVVDQELIGSNFTLTQLRERVRQAAE